MGYTDLDGPLANAWDAETDVQRMNTHAFIMSLPVQVTLTPHAPVRTASGGVAKTAGTPRAEQTMRIVEPDASLGGWAPVAALDGVERKNRYILLGEWDSVMAVGDRFTYNGRDCEIIELLPPLPYERRGLVNAHG